MQLLSIGSICNSLMGVLIYFHIVRKRHTPMAFIVAFGIVVPLSLLVPYYLVQLLDIRNSAMIFSLLATGPLTPFHCFEGRFEADCCLSLTMNTMLNIFRLFLGSLEWHMSTICRKRRLAFSGISHIRSGIQCRCQDRSIGKSWSKGKT